MSHRCHGVADVTTSHRGHDVSRTSRRLIEVTTSHGRHDVSRRSRRLTDVADVTYVADITDVAAV